MLIGADATRVAEVRWACSMCKQSAGEVKLYSAANGCAIVRNSSTASPDPSNPTGQRFLIQTPQESSGVPLTPVTNWTAGLKKWRSARRRCSGDACP